jgi:hypothetical protein
MGPGMILASDLTHQIVEIRIIDHELKLFPAVDQECHRTVVHQLNIHVSLKPSRGGLHAAALNFGDEDLIETVGLFWSGGFDETWATPFTAIAIQGELADDQHSPSNIQ